MRRSLALAARAPIVAGPMRGLWWLPAGGGKILRVLGGTYERGHTELFRTHVRPGDVVLDLGAHIGYYTLLASRLAGPAGRVYAFEPDARNAWYLRQHVRINGCGNTEVLECAAYDRTGRVSFGTGTGTGTGRVLEAGVAEVPAIRIDEFVAERGIAPDVLKIDVEGAERRVLDGARDMLERDRPVIFLSTHGEEQAGACKRLLGELGYEMEPLPGATADLLCTPDGRPPSGAAAIGPPP